MHGNAGTPCSRSPKILGTEIRGKIKRPKIRSEPRPTRPTMRQIYVIVIEDIFDEAIVVVPVNY